ncbi:MAG: hypothetical protein HYV60_17065 [Planctomycetia bacterium]|nr:hypothetical protein [Planctomycetia bacterium]
MLLILCRDRFSVLMTMCNLLATGCSRDSTEYDREVRPAVSDDGSSRATRPLVSDEAFAASEVASSSDSYGELVRARSAELRVALSRIGREHARDGRGPGGVLTVGLTPWKVIATEEGVQLHDEDGLPRREMKSNVPYYVFQNRGDGLLVCRIQDEELAARSGGWVNGDACFSWYSRRLVYPRPDGELARTLTLELGTAGALPSFDPTTMMPWPILAEMESEHGWLVLCDFRHYGADMMVLPVMAAYQREFDIYVLFTEVELNRVLRELTALVAIIDSGRMPISDVPRVLGAFLTQNQVDFMEFQEIEETLDVFPGRRLRLIRGAIRDQIEWLVKVSRSRGHYNEAHGVYVLPLDALGETRI